MSMINVKAEEFPRIVTCYLLDVLVNEKDMPIDEDFKEIMNKIKPAKSYILKYYMKMGSPKRFNYRKIRKGIVGQSKSNIVLLPMDKKEITKIKKKDKTSTIKKIINMIKGV